MTYNRYRSLNTSRLLWHFLIDPAVLPRRGKKERPSGAPGKQNVLIIMFLVTAFGTPRGLQRYITKHKAMKRAHCTECEWALTNKSGSSRTEVEVNQLIIHHHIDTGHHIESGDDVEISFIDETQDDTQGFTRGH
jgi:hypothetical protein